MENAESRIGREAGGSGNDRLKPGFEPRLSGRELQQNRSGTEQEDRHERGDLRRQRQLAPAEFFLPQIDQRQKAGSFR